MSICQNDIECAGLRPAKEIVTPVADPDACIQVCIKGGSGGGGGGDCNCPDITAGDNVTVECSDTECVVSADVGTDDIENLQDQIDQITGVIPNPAVTHHAVFRKVGTDNPVHWDNSATLASLVITAGNYKLETYLDSVNTIGLINDVVIPFADGQYIYVDMSTSSILYTTDVNAIYTDPQNVIVGYMHWEGPANSLYEAVDINGRGTYPNIPATVSTGTAVVRGVPSTFTSDWVDETHFMFKAGSYIFREQLTGLSRTIRLTADVSLEFDFSSVIYYIPGQNVFSVTSAGAQPVGSISFGSMNYVNGLRTVAIDGLGVFPFGGINGFDISIVDGEFTKIDDVNIDPVSDLSGVNFLQTLTYQVDATNASGDPYIWLKSTYPDGQEYLANTTSRSYPILVDGTLLEPQYSAIPDKYTLAISEHHEPNVFYINVCSGYPGSYTPEAHGFLHSRIPYGDTVMDQYGDVEDWLLPGNPYGAPSFTVITSTTSLGSNTGRYVYRYAVQNVANQTTTYVRAYARYKDADGVSHEIVGKVLSYAKD